MRRFNLKEFWHRLRPHPMLPAWERWLRWTLIGGSALLIFTLTVTTGIVVVFSFGLPDIEKGEDLLQAQSTLIMDREGNLLYAVHGEENREIVPIDDISPYLIDATVAVEDDEYFEHHGFDIPCYVKAVGYEVFKVGIRRGCSTITQQLVKNVFLTPEQTYKRKIQELILAVRVENRFNKDEILEMYLNEIPYGNNAYGAQLASQTYFGKDAADLSLTESAILASLPKAPTRYSPYGSNKTSYLLKEFSAEELNNRSIRSEADLKVEEYVRGLIGANIQLANGTTLYIPGRVDIVLDSMLEQGMITETQKQLAIEESWTIAFNDYKENIKYPHFVLYVKELLEEEYGKDAVEQGGLKVYTTIDPKMQEIAEESVAKYKEKNLTQFDATNASLVAIHPETGQILAMVGSADYFDEDIDGNVNIATRYRQPGSSFKPFIYALTFLNGYAPATVLYDVRTQFGPGDYPQNYDGTYRGPMTIRTALGQSRNIPAIKAYFLAGQEEKIIPFMEGFGIDLDETIGYGWPLALGSGEVRLLDLVGAYAVFANDGVKQEVTPILKIENSLGEVIEQWKDTPGEQVLDPQIAYLITDILSDTSVQIGPRLSIPGQFAAAKTGTSNKVNEDGKEVPNNAWTLGYTTKLTGGVWVGNADGTEMYYTANGYDTAAPIWNDFMTNALAEIDPEQFSRPEGITELAVSSASGLLISELTPDDKIRTDKFASFNVPTEVDDRWVVLPVDKTTGLIPNEYTPQWSIIEKVFLLHKSIIPEYTYWQSAIDAWATGMEDIDKAPTDLDNIHTAETLANAPTIVILDPTSYGTVERGANTVTVSVSAPNGMDKVEFYLNDDLQFTAISSPYEGTVRIYQNAALGSTYEIFAYIYDDLGYRSTSSVLVQVGETAGPPDDESNPDGDSELTNNNEATPPAMDTF